MLDVREVIPGDICHIREDIFEQAELHGNGVTEDLRWKSWSDDGMEAMRELIIDGWIDLDDRADVDHNDIATYWFRDEESDMIWRVAWTQEWVDYEASVQLDNVTDNDFDENMFLKLIQWHS